MDRSAEVFEGAFLGAWDEARGKEFAPFAAAGMAPGRVLEVNRDVFRVWTAAGALTAYPAGGGGGAAPTGAGDWVAVDSAESTAVVRGVLGRRSFFSRQAAGREVREQVLAANVDFALILLGLDRDYNQRRLDRYLVQARRGGVRPVVVLTKADLCRDPVGFVARTEYDLKGTAVHAISVQSGYGLADLGAFLRPGSSCLLTGSSGVGKSTLVNHLAGEEVAPTGAVRESDGRGRATTTSTRGFLTGGAWVFDSPGLREVQLWGSDGDIAGAFADIAELARGCRYGDCGHQGEPGCAVRAALERGEVSAERLLNYRKLRQELGSTRESVQRARKKRSRAIALLVRNYRKVSRE
jgi:ribosome biogenesis GTPase